MKLAEVAKKILKEEGFDKEGNPYGFKYDEEQEYDIKDLEKRLIKALKKTDEASYAGLFPKEMKELLKDGIKVLRKASPEDQLKIVELEEKWAELMNKTPGRPADPNHPIHKELGSIYSKYV